MRPNSRKHASRKHLQPAVTLGATLLLTVSVCSAQQIIFPGEQWQIATPESVLVDSERLEAAISAFDRSAASVQEMVIVRNGRLIWQGENPHHSQHVYSMTKSFTSTAMGLLVDDGKIRVDSSAKDFVPALAEKYGDATVGHFATHTSGYLAAGEVVPLGSDLAVPEDPYAPGDPLFEPPGSSFAYTGTAMDMWAYVLSQAAGERLDELFKRRIAEPIGMAPDEFAWRGFTTAEGDFVNGGSGYLDYGVEISAENAARLGHLYANLGNWDGEQLLSREWIDEATSVQVPSTVPRDPLSATNGPGQYGFGWWISALWHEAIGYQNNYTSVSPSMGFVVSRLGTESGFAGFDSFKTALLLAVMPAVWDEQGDGAWDAFDPTTGKPRWRTEDGFTPDIYPTVEAIVRSNQVTVGNELEVRNLTIESGEVMVLEDGLLRLTNRTDVEPAGQLSVFGKLEASRLNVDGMMTIGGPVSVERLTIDAGTVQLTNSGADYQVTTRLTLNRDSEISFLVDSRTWNSTLELTEGSRVALFGDLTLDFPPTLDLETLEGATLDLFDWNGRVPITTFAQLNVPSRVELDTSQLYTTGDVTVMSVLDRPVEAGDFDANGILDVADADALSARILTETHDQFYDLTGDGLLTLDDLDFWVHDLKKTYFGDANLDGVFNSGDFVSVFQAGKFETGTEAGWGEGDWNADGLFNSTDFVRAFEDRGYEPEVRPKIAVPEPTATCLLSIAAACILWNKRRR